MPQENLQKELEEKNKELAELRKKNEKAEAQLHPETGPGTWCECWKVSMGESAQLHADEQGNFPSTPEGFYTHKRADSNRQYLMRPTKQKPNGRDVVTVEDDKGKHVVTFHPECNSKYTKAKMVKFREKGKSYPDFEYEEKEIHLCDKHAKLFGA